jgi:hypothetical protein
MVGHFGTSEALQNFKARGQSLTVEATTVQPKNARAIFGSGKRNHRLRRENDHGLRDVAPVEAGPDP